MWEHINKFYLMVRDGGTLDDVLDNPYAFFEQVNVSGQQFLGVTDATMTHGEAWHFCQLGPDARAGRQDVAHPRREVLHPAAQADRRGHAVRRHPVAGPAAVGQRLEMYRQRHGRISPVNVVNFLVLDREFPRAVLHCLTRANESLHAISGTHTGSFCNPAEQRLGQLRAELAYTQAEEVIASGLHEFVDDLQTRLNQVGEAIHESFFAMRPLEVATGR